MNPIEAPTPPTSPEIAEAVAIDWDEMHRAVVQLEAILTPHDAGDAH